MVVCGFRVYATNSNLYGPREGTVATIAATSHAQPYTHYNTATDPHPVRVDHGVR